MTANQGARFGTIVQARPVAGFEIDVRPIVRLRVPDAADIMGIDRDAQWSYSIREMEVVTPDEASADGARDRAQLRGEPPTGVCTAPAVLAHGREHAIDGARVMEAHVGQHAQTHDVIALVFVPRDHPLCEVR